MVEAKEVELQIKIANTRPVELVDIGQSFKALGELYENYVDANEFDKTAGNAKLYLVRVQSGSILASLKGFLDQASFIVDHAEVLAGFVGNLFDLIEFFRIQRATNGAPNTSPGPVPTRFEAERIAKIVEPIAKDGGSQLNLNIQGNVSVHVTNVSVDSERANAVQNNVRRFLGPPVPETGHFEKEVLYLEQMRKGVSSVGDRGIIENFSTRPVKLLFMSEEVKDAIIGKPQNPFQMAYIVDGIVSTARGEPALYKIMKVHDALGPARQKKKTRRRNMTLSKKKPRGRSAA